jgi:hypothetical protein
MVYRRWQAGAAILAVMIVVTFLYIRSKKPNPEVGHWKALTDTLNIYDDGIASFNGNKCTWKALNKYTLRLQCSIGEYRMIGEFNNGHLQLGETDLYFTKAP